MSSGQTSQKYAGHIHTHRHAHAHTQTDRRREKRTLNFDPERRSVGSPSDRKFEDQQILKTHGDVSAVSPEPLPPPGPSSPHPTPHPHLTLGADPPAPSRRLAASVSSVSLLELAGNQSGAHLQAPPAPPLPTPPLLPWQPLPLPSSPSLRSKSVRSGPSRSISTTSRLIGASTLYVGISRHQS